jgi:hypothetical protein
MLTFLVVIVLIFSLLNFALLLPLVRVVSRLMETMLRFEDEPSVRRDRDNGLMDIDTPQINYHNLIPPAPKDLD